MNDITVLEEQENPQEETVQNDQVETGSVQETREESVTVKNGLHQEENSVEQPEKEETVTEEQPDIEEQISESALETDSQETEPTKVASPKVQVSPIITW